MKSTLALLLFAAFAAAPGFSENVAPGDKTEQAKSGMKEACAADAAKFCPGMHPGDGKFGPCMKEHKEQLSEKCRGAAEAGKEALKNRIAGRAEEACGADGAKFCQGMKPGDGKFGPCLKEHKEELSESCKKFMGRMAHFKKGRAGKEGKGGDDGKDTGNDHQ